MYASLIPSSLPLQLYGPDVVGGAAVVGGGWGAFGRVVVVDCLAVVEAGVPLPERGAPGLDPGTAAAVVQVFGTVFAPLVRPLPDA